MYILKQLPEDFIVKEISNVEIKDKGKYFYYKLKKTNRNTLDVVKEIAKQLNVKEKQVGFAGSKDKHAVTEQLISAPKKLDKINIDKVSLEFLGYGNKPISLGDLEENEFEIVVRHLENFSIDKINLVENYFDEQRFSLHNVDIGRHLIKKEFEDAVKLIDDSRANEHLKKRKNDFIGALKNLPIRLLRMYVNAYQSYLWNETLAGHLRKKGKVLKEVEYSLGKIVFVSDAEKFVDLEIPLIGFGCESLDNFKDIIKKIMEKENLDYPDFVIKQIPELSLEGDLRKAFVKINNLKISKETNDDFNKDKKKLTVKFSLGKGSYATMVVRRMISLE
ncbi:MAG: tRNA pseudouridine(13) synthase TruD [Nanoarchaeota archaeon]|nr:tRNA pseudouridine(13) synthase TruD [Nanoarchaeota archaeon]MBU1632831.1 tRNA pseudouridine(13) synthase TruD [Nanoarchaeota archaeon]MBU1876476.1 tRNA pseudouridine(13) synthase TruD [Nanoarchaeota archaeon]